MKRRAARWMAAVLVAMPAADATADVTVRRWTLSDGLPQSSVVAIAEAPDGALWLGTYGGLVRFDGARFRVLDNASTPGLPSNRVTALTVDDEGAIWGGSQEGTIFRLHEGGADAWKLEGPDIQKMVTELVSHEGRLVIGATASVWTFDPRTDDAPRIDGRVGGAATSMASSRDGVWLTVEDSVRRLTPSDADLLPPPPGHRWREPELHQPRGSGPVWITDPPLTAVIMGGRAREVDLEAVELPEWMRHVPPHTVALQRFLGPVARVSVRGEVGARVRTLVHRVVHDGESLAAASHIDRHDQLWIGYGRDGLECHARSPVQSLPGGHAPTERETSTVFVHRDGSVWAVAQFHHVVRVAPDGEFEAHVLPGAWAITEGDGNSVLVSVGRSVVPIAPGAVGEPMGPWSELGAIHSILRDPARTVWLGAHHGLFRLDPGAERPEQVTDETGQVSALAVDDDGVIWAAGPDTIHRVDGSHTRSYPLGAPASTGEVRTMICHDGGVWAATYGGGIFVVDGDGAVRQITTRDGLPVNVLCGMIADHAQDALWLLGNQGAYHVQLSAWAEFLDGARRFPRFRAYVSADGMVEASHGHPSGGTLADGSVVVTTVNGPRVIRPVTSSEPDVMSPAVEEVRIDGVAIELNGGPVRVPAGANRIEIAVSTVNLLAPDSSQFACRLRGFDDAWTDTGPDGAIAYTRLAPGAYTFDVRAALGDGPWVEARTPLEIEWLPAWHERTAVRAGVMGGAALLLVIVVIAVFRNHRHKLSVMHGRIERQHAARERERRLVDEVNHRVRNNLASVLSMIRLAEASERLAGPLASRIHAMAAAHDVLSTRHWSAVRLSEIIDAVVRREQPNRPDALVVIGQDPRIDSRRCQSLALTMNELAANAGEHGAWSVDTGVVTIDVKEVGGGEIVISWVETGGPAVAPPTRLGRGLELAQGFTRHDLAGTMTLEFDRAGLRAEIQMPTEEPRRVPSS
jgi:two-component sensor histidine kinase/ligand-binding sensor domain-containing protein